MSGNGFHVVVHFSEPVPGIHPIDGGLFRADRHVFNAHHVWQDATETKLIAADDVTVAEWPTHLVERVEWKLSVSGAGQPVAARPAAAAQTAAAQTAVAQTAVAQTAAAPQTTTPSDTQVAAAAASDAASMPSGVDPGDWIQPMTLKTSSPEMAQAASSGSPRPASS
jgi:hypothetical protein